MRLREREPETRSVMCFPSFPIYRKLSLEIRSSLIACGIEVWLISADGEVEILR